MKMCRHSVEPMPSRITVPVFSFQRRKMSAGSASAAETQARMLEKSRGFFSSAASWAA